MKYWIAIFGASKTVFSGNGGDFIGESFVEMCEQFNIKIKTTPSESPWCNGLCERQNQTGTSILLKVKEDTQGVTMRLYYRGHFVQKMHYLTIMDLAQHN